MFPSSSCYLYTGDLSTYVLSSPPLYGGGGGVQPYSFMVYHKALDFIDSKAFHRINSPSLTDCLQSLKFPRNDASLCLLPSLCSQSVLFLICTCLPHPLCGLAAQHFLLTLTHPFPVHFKNATANLCFQTGIVWLILCFHLPATDFKSKFVYVQLRYIINKWKWCRAWHGLPSWSSLADINKFRLVYIFSTDSLHIHIYCVHTCRYSHTYIYTIRIFTITINLFCKDYQHDEHWGVNKESLILLLDKGQIFDLIRFFIFACRYP